ncbi:helix-turn-helix domain-containing protein [Janibacter anophelis]|uniref:helix-turn-helix domain-containing protein n=1 Tax=Janibacter anophelis TaxID=319054 RepID=UPI000DEF6CDB|nr:helix-turn-helix transcriptional regulator [Janibacter anophelis]
MVLLREELGDVLRDARRAQGRTLRDISARASVSLGYLSEIERGEKEASSELLASICTALGMPMSLVLTEVAQRADRAERASVPVTLPVASRSEDVVSAA